MSSSILIGVGSLLILILVFLKHLRIKVEGEFCHIPYLYKFFFKFFLDGLLVFFINL